MAKRSSIDAFFAPSSAKKAKTRDDDPGAIPLTEQDYDHHGSYPVPLPSRLPFTLQTNTAHKQVNDKPDLDVHYYQPVFPAAVARQLFEFLRDEFCWYRVTYQVRGLTINTPRYTTVFGLDDTHYFSPPPGRDESKGESHAGDTVVLEKSTHKPPRKPFPCRPRPLPGCLDQIRRAVESLNGGESDGKPYNFCLLNYYKDGSDSISYHSDDESFLGPNPTIASLSLGATRDFAMRNKADHGVVWKTALRGGDMVVMRGPTQAKWDHAVPKRAGTRGRSSSSSSSDGQGGRINITFRRALVPYGTVNYYRYNVHDGPYFRWDRAQGSMVLGSTFVQPSSSSSSSSSSAQHLRTQETTVQTQEKVETREEAQTRETTGETQEMGGVDGKRDAGTAHGEGQGRDVPILLQQEDSFDVAAQIRAIDEAVERAEREGHRA